MYYRRRYKTLPHRTKSHFIVVTDSFNTASPNITLNNLDLLANWRSHASLSVNLPIITVWRVKVRVSIIVTLAAALGANDGVVSSLFVDSYDQTPNNQITDTFDQQYLHYDIQPCAAVSFNTDVSSAGTYVLTRTIRPKYHRRLRALDDTLWLQLASSGQAHQTSIAYTQQTVLKIG